MTQLPLLEDVQREERPWKVVRRVSRQVIYELRKGGYVGRQTIKVITALAWYRNSTMRWPTAAELTRFMFQRKRITRDDPRLVAPRLTEMTRGRVVKLADGERHRVGGGVLALFPVRPCQVTGAMAHPVSIREMGSAERQAV